MPKHAKGQRGILKSAYEKNVPVFVPAFSDSELGLDCALNNRERDKKGKPRFRFDPFEDLEYFAATLLQSEAAGNFHHRWRRSAQLVAAVWTVHRTAPSAGRGKPAAEALSLWAAHLPGTSLLGRPFRQSLQRSDFVGQVCASGGRRKIWRSVCGCYRGPAADRRGGVWSG